MFEVEIEKSESQHLMGIRAHSDLLAGAASATPVRYSHKATTNPHNPWQDPNLPHATADSLTVLGTNSFCPGMYTRSCGLLPPPSPAPPAPSSPFSPPSPPCVPLLFGLVLSPPPPPPGAERKEDERVVACSQITLSPLPMRLNTYVGMESSNQPNKV